MDPKLRYIVRYAKVIVLLCLGAVLTGCKVDFSVPNQTPIELSVYQSDRKVFTGPLRGDDLVVVTVNGWVAAHPDGWSYAFMTRPRNIYIAGENFSVNIQEYEVSVKYCRGLLGCHFYVKNNDDLYPLILNTATLKALALKK